MQPISMELCRRVLELPTLRAAAAAFLSVKHMQSKIYIVQSAKFHLNTQEASSNLTATLVFAFLALRQC